MKKPVNKVALALWIVAALFVLDEAWTTFDVIRATAKLGQGDVYLVSGGIARIVQSVVATAGMLTGTGMLVELVDQIRWAVVRASAKA